MVLSMNTELAKKYERYVSPPNLCPVVSEQQRYFQVVELKMCRFSYYIRSIPHWWEKIDDPDAMKEWRKASDNDYFLQDETHMKEEEEYLDLRLFPSLTDHQIDWVLDELSSYAQRIERASGCQVRPILESSAAPFTNHVT